MYAGEAGFADELGLLFPQGKYPIGISRWDGREDADACSRDIYPQVLKDVVELVEGTHADSAFHEIAAHN
jgi:hypothetical protein